MRRRRVTAACRRARFAELAFDFHLQGAKSPEAEARSHRPRALQEG
jgi:catechol 1,2-dioxygenase